MGWKSHVRFGKRSEETGRSRDRNRASDRLSHETPRPDEGPLLPPVRADRHHSRFNPSWIVSTVEESHLAADFLADAIARNGAAPHTVQSMTSKPVSALLTDLGVTRTHSRPRVSNDNPYSESQYRTLNYLPDFPANFNSLTHAKQFLTEFFYQYNYIHRHSGIGWHAPSSVHFGTSGAIDEARQQTLTAAYHTNPARFGRRPRPPAVPTQAWINQPEAQPQMN